MSGFLGIYPEYRVVDATGTYYADGSISTGSIYDWAGAIVTYKAQVVSAATSTISANSPVTADGLTTTTITVTARDAAGDVMPGIPAANVVVAATGSFNTLAQPTTATDANGQTTATLRSTAAEGKTVSVTIDGTPITQTASVTFTPSAFYKLAFWTQPVNTTAGTTMSAVVVQIQDGSGAPVAQSGTAITLTLNGGTLYGGTTTRNTNVSGEATFDDLVIQQAVTGLTFTAAGGGLGAALSATFDVTAATAGTLVFTTQPASTTSGSTMAAVVVQLQDAFGNAVPQSGTPITLTVNGSTLYSGANPQNTDATGKATFDDLVIRQSGTGLTFDASSNSLTPATSNAFNITATITAPVGIGTAGYGSSSSYISSLAVPVTSDVPANDTVIVAVVLYNNNAPTVTVSDSAGNSYTKNADITNSFTRTLLFSAQATGALTNDSSSITVSAPTVRYINVSAFSVGGLVSPSPVDRTATATGSSTTPSVGPTSTTTQANEILVGAFGVDVGSGTASLSAGTNYSLAPSNVTTGGMGIFPEHRIVTATGAYSANGTLMGTVSNWSAAIVTYKSGPALTSPTATSIGSTTATLGATVESEGSGSLSARGTCWATTATPRTNCAAEDGTALGAFAQDRASLTAGTRFYYAGYATNSAAETGYSPDGSFYTEPATQASGVAFTSVTATGMTVNWTRGSGNGVIVLIKAATAVDADPVDGTYTAYTASAAFGGGTQIWHRQLRDLQGDRYQRRGHGPDTRHDLLRRRLRIRRDR